VAALAGLVEENYGRLTTNISPDSIYTGALGAALFAHREWRRARMITAGIDVGSASIKLAVVAGRASPARPHGEDPPPGPPEDRGGPVRLRPGRAVPLARRPRLRGHTGEGEMVPFRTGHFYGMTTHTRGGLFLDPEARAVIDIGALHTRAVLMDARAKVLAYRMTSQCASGRAVPGEHLSLPRHHPRGDRTALAAGGQAGGLLVHLRRPLRDRRDQHGVARDHRTEHHQGHPSVHGRALPAPAHLGGRQGPGAGDGGLAADVGLVAALREAAEEGKAAIEIRTHPDSVMAGALGAALWGAFRAPKLSRLAAGA
jgi:benzoyl-CoA reductase subunit D